MGGPIALVEEGDLIRIDVPNRQLAIVGVNGEEKTPEEMEAILAQRRANWKPKAPKYTKGLLLSARRQPHEGRLHGVRDAPAEAGTNSKINCSAMLC